MSQTWPDPRAVPDTWQGTYQDEPLAQRQIALIDLLDRLLAGGIVLTGDLALTIADVELVRISLRALIHSVEAPVSRLTEPDAAEPGTANRSAT